MSDVRIDLVVRDPATGDIRLVFVEEGPWPDPQESELLARLQARIYDAVDAVVDGTFAERFPETHGCFFRFVLDCFKAPPPEVPALVEAMNRGLHEGRYGEWIRSSPALKGLRVEFNDRGAPNDPIP